MKSRRHYYDHSNIKYNMFPRSTKPMDLNIVYPIAYRYSDCWF